MAEYVNREHYIPLRKSDLVDLLCQDKGMTAEQGQQFRRFCSMVSATYHFEFLKLFEELKDEYDPFNPDAVTVHVKTLSAAERQQRLDRLFERFGLLMERANFQRLSQEVVRAATLAASDWGLNMAVDFAVFERLEMYVRGDTTGLRYRRRWHKFFRRESAEVPIYQRVALIMKLRPHKRLGKDIDTAAVFLKIFKDIPKMDMEMLLPGARVQMHKWTRLKLGGSMVSGLALIAYNIIQQLLTAAVMAVQFFWGPLVAVLGYGYKQWYGYQVTKQTYSLQLTRSLYYQNLDNNAGVMCHLLDEAEEQECRETILAYYYLWRYPNEEGWTAANLDDFVEMDLERLANLKVDFESDDALAKLEKLNIVDIIAGRYRARPIDKALQTLDRAWDNYFDFNSTQETQPATLGTRPGAKDL